MTDSMTTAVRAARNAVATGTSLGPETLSHLLDYITELEASLWEFSIGHREEGDGF